MVGTLDRCHLFKVFAIERFHCIAVPLSSPNTHHHPPTHAVAVLKEFDVFWRESEPANIMDFPRVKQQFMQRLQAELASTGLLTCMTHTNNKN